MPADVRLNTDIPAAERAQFDEMLKQKEAEELVCVLAFALLLLPLLLC